MVFTPVSGAVAGSGLAAGAPGFMVAASQVNPETDIVVRPDAVARIINRLANATTEIRNNLVQDVHVEPSAFGNGYPCQRAGMGHQRAHFRMAEVLEGVSRDIERFSESLAMVVSDLEEIDDESAQAFSRLEAGVAFDPQHTEDAESRPAPSTPEPVTPGDGGPSSEGEAGPVDTEGQSA